MPRPSTTIRLAAHAALLATLMALLGVLNTHAARASAEAPQTPEPSARHHPRTCLVLSGGGARGIAHIGVLKVLEELRVPIDCIVGTSMGSIIGGAYASGTSAAEIERLVRTIEWDRVLRDETPRPERSMYEKQLERRQLAPVEFGVRGSNLVLPLGAVVGRQLEEVLRVLAGPSAQLKSFDDLPIAFRAIATDIETGRMVVMDRGSVTTAMRASMSVPGVFAPQARDGRLLVDGGLVRNLPVDVARALGAERIIAVNLGTPLLERKEVDSLLGVTEQMLNILTEQNVTVSLAGLQPGDVLIQPELGSFSAANFADSIRNIEVGERGARAAAAQLAPLAVPPEAYEAWLARRASAAPRPAFERVLVNTDGLNRVNAESVKAIFDAAVAGRSGDEALQSGTRALYATDDFELVGLGLEGEAASPTLVVEPHEKSWGPSYAHFGLSLSTDAEGESAFNALAELRSTWLDARALEWRAIASIGDETSLDTELLQPLDLRRRWFVSGGVGLLQRLEDLFVEEQTVARYRSRTARASLDVGRYFGTGGEARAGYELARLSLRTASGLSPIPQAEDEATALHAGLVLDRLDDWNFPGAGYYAKVSVKVADRALGGDLDYERYQLDVQKAFGFGRHDLTLGARFGESHGALPLVEAFDLGGFQTLSGAVERQYLGQSLRFGRVVYRYRMRGGGGIARRRFVGGSLEAGRIGERINGTRDSARLASSVFLGLDTILGPLYFGGGFAEGGDQALYLFLGRP